MAHDPIGEMLYEFDKAILADLKNAAHGGHCLPTEVDIKKAIADMSSKAFTIPGTLPANNYKGPKYQVMFDRIVTPKVAKSIVPAECSVFPPKLVNETLAALAVPKSVYQGSFANEYLQQPLPMTQAMPEATNTEKLLSFFAYGQVGMSIGHIGGLAHVDFCDDAGDVSAGMYGHALAMVGPPDANGNVFFHNSWGLSPSGLKDIQDAWGIKLPKKAVDPPIAVVECDGRVIYLPDPFPETPTRRRPRSIVL